MTKAQADKKVLQYKDKIFGFALSKTKDYQQAEELSSQIICEVYISLLKTDNIVNFDGYIYRLASNIYSKFINGLVQGRKVSSIDSTTADSSLASEDKYFYEDNKKELEILKKEIGYLSERQRTIVYLHYYQNMSVTTIAKALNISANTVKWHLSDARSTLKEVMIMNYENETIDTNQAVNPVTFKYMGHCGTPGTNNSDTTTMFDSRIKQNIAWSCYWEAKTLSEIARTIGVPIAYVKDELQKLVDYGYIDQIDNSKNPKFLTNMVIFDERGNRPESHKYDFSAEQKETAKKLCSELFKPIFADFEADSNHWGMSCPNNDVNFMKYSLVMAVMNNLGSSEGYSQIEKLKVKRPDGGNFVAISTVTDDCSPSGGSNDYWIMGYMWNGTENGFTLQVQCKYTDRSMEWRENLFTDELIKFYTNNCNPDSLQLEEYELLQKSGMLEGKEIQCVTMKGGNTSVNEQIKPYMEKFSGLVEDLKLFGKDLDERIFEKIKPAFPSQALPFIKASNTDSIFNQTMIPYIIEEMIAAGMLEKLNEKKAKASMYILSI